MIIESTKDDTKRYAFSNLTCEIRTYEPKYFALLTGGAKNSQATAAIRLVGAQPMGAALADAIAEGSIVSVWCRSQCVFVGKRVVWPVGLVLNFLLIY